MSRTYRLRKAGYLPWWADYTWKQWVDINPNEEIDPSWEIRCVHYYSIYTKVRYERKLQGKELKKIVSLSYRDKGVPFKEHGPHWFRNLYSQRPHRRAAKVAIAKWVRYNDYHDDCMTTDLIVESKPKLEYWT